MLDIPYIRITIYECPPPWNIQDISAIDAIYNKRSDGFRWVLIRLEGFHLLTSHFHGSYKKGFWWIEGIQVTY